MNGWAVFFIIVFVLGIILSNILLLKQTAKTKVPDHIIKKVAERRAKEAEMEEQKEKQNKKPTDH
tara:strand:- start:3910 stop:4104 length:195 start_codon:yes stop_codon:yes gene_type:complete